MKNFKELMSRYQNVDFQKEIREKRLLTEDDVVDYLSKSKIYPEYFFHHQLYSEIVGKKNNPYHLSLKSINHNGVEYVIKDSLDEEIERISNIFSAFDDASKKIFDVLNLCRV